VRQAVSRLGQDEEYKVPGQFRNGLLSSSSQFVGGAVRFRIRDLTRCAASSVFQDGEDVNTGSALFRVDSFFGGDVYFSERQSNPGAISRLLPRSSMDEGTKLQKVQVPVAATGKIVAGQQQSGSFR